VRPLQARDGVAGRFLGHQRFQGGQQSGRFFSVRGRPPPNGSNPVAEVTGANLVLAAGDGCTA
jgi:hypothetical protein